MCVEIHTLYFHLLMFNKKFVIINVKQNRKIGAKYIRFYIKTQIKQYLKVNTQ